MSAAAGVGEESDGRQGCHFHQGLPLWAQIHKFCTQGVIFLQVDNVIQETKNLMNEIAKLVTACFVCATKVRLLPSHSIFSSLRLIVNIWLTKY